MIYVIYKEKAGIVFFNFFPNFLLNHNKSLHPMKAMIKKALRPTFAN